MEDANPVVLFDGFCNLCNWSVDFILKRDRDKQIRFLSLQEEKVKVLFPDFSIPENVDSVLLLKGDQIFMESDAVLEISRYLVFPWNHLVIFRIVPRFLRNKIYRLFSRNRSVWFGRRETCRIPGPGEMDRFL